MIAGSNAVAIGAVTAVNVAGWAAAPLLAPAAAPLALAAMVAATLPHWGLVHEAMHGHLAVARCNRRLGRMLAVALLLPFEPVRFGHLMHHRHNRHRRDRPAPGARQSRGSGEARTPRSWRSPCRAARLQRRPPAADAPRLRGKPRPRRDRLLGLRRLAGAGDRPRAARHRHVPGRQHGALRGRRGSARRTASASRHHAGSRPSCPVITTTAPTPAGPTCPGSASPPPSPRRATATTRRTSQRRCAS
jgi:hypothetical protein